MIFDVMIREGTNHLGKQMVNTYRYHDSQLSSCIRNIQNVNLYIVGVIPLFRNKQVDIAQQYIDGTLDKNEDQLRL